MTGTAELSFVRCWNCESLISAALQECGVCGVVLDSAEPMRRWDTAPDPPPVLEGQPEFVDPQVTHHAQPLTDWCEKPADSSAPLLGWFAVFHAGRRASFELEPGAFFVSRTRMRRNDLVLDVEEIASPHALFTAEKEGATTRVFVQDLLSISGIAIRRGTRFFRVDEGERTELLHGDRVVLGELSLVLCLLPE